MKLQSVIISSVKTMKDGGLRITLDTQELLPEEVGVLFGLHQSACDVTIENPEFLTN